MLNAFVQTQLKFVSYFGDTPQVSIPIIFLTGLYLYSRNFKKEAVLVFLSSLSYFLSIILKLIFQHQRPENTIYFQKTVPFDFYSFPSSHVVVYTAFLGYVFYLVLKLKTLPNILRVIAGFTCIYFISTVGISRIALGVHWPKDIIAGYIVGGACLLLLVILDKKVKYSVPKD